MAINKKITELTDLTVVSSGDLLPIVDVSEGDINERNKKVTIATLTASLGINSPLTTKGDIYVRDNIGNGRLSVGTNGQILSANSSTATGLEWIARPGFDSPLTTKGDLLTFDIDNTRIGVGGDGQVLSANSSTSTGLEWITPEGGEDYLAINSTGAVPQVTGINGVAIGENAVAASNNSFQLGDGTNIVDNSLQFRGIQVADIDGLVTSFTSPANYIPSSPTSVDEHFVAIDLAIGLAGETTAKFATEQATSFTLDDTFHGKFIPVNSNAGDITITFDNTIRDGFQVILFHKGNTNQIILNANGQTLFSKGLTIQNDNATATIAYDGATTTWYAIGDLI